MKKIFTFFGAMVVALGLNAQSITVDKVLNDLAGDFSSGCEIDLNNDGIKELIFGGNPNTTDNIATVIYDANGDEILVEGHTAWLLQWDGSDYKYSQFSDYGIFGVRGEIVPCDFNGDGYVDIYIAAGGDQYSLNGIYLNDGNGGFVKDESFLVVDENGEPYYVYDSDGEPSVFWDGTLVNWLPRNIDIADFNCDGLPDIVSCGWWLSSARHDTAMNGVLLNNGDGTFTLTNQYLMGLEDDEIPYSFALCSIKAYDLNNDGYADFIVQGNVDNSDAYTDGRRFMVFENLGEYNEPGMTEFFDLGLSEGVSHDRGNGSIAVADFNNDGTPDIFITGEDPNYRNTYYPSYSEYAYFAQILKGSIDSDGFAEYSNDASFVAYDKDIRPLNANNTSVRAIDYNGDGYVDLFFNGWCETMLDNSSNTQAGWFLPGSASGLISYQRIPGSSEHSMFFLDYGVEGDLNFSFTGFHGDTNYFDIATYANAYDSDGNLTGNRSLVLTKNPWTVAERPDAPTDPTVEVDGNTVTLSWTPAATSMKNVTYEYYLKSNGKIYNGCTSFIGDDKDGVRKVLREGNAYQNTKLTLTLPDGTYDWGVQTINAALKGSTFANGARIIVGDGGEDAILNVEANVEEGPAVYYNIAGQRVTENYKGVVVVNGKKVLNQ